MPNNIVGQLTPAALPLSAEVITISTAHATTDHDYSASIDGKTDVEI